MLKAFAVDNAPGETDVQFVVVVKMGKLFAFVEKGGESVIPVRPRAILNSELLESLSQLNAEMGHLRKFSLKSGDWGTNRITLPGQRDGARNIIASGQSLRCPTYKLFTPQVSPLRFRQELDRTTL